MTQSLSSKQSTMGASRLPDENDQRPLAKRDSLDQKTRSALEANEAHLAKIISALHNSLGLVQAGRRDLAGAANEFRLAKRWNPQQAGLDYNLGLAYFRAEAYKEALAPLESEVKANPQNVQAKWLLGLSYFHTQEYSKAAELLQDVLTSESTNVELWYALASSLIKQQQLETAGRAIERMSVLTAGNQNNRLALARYELGKALLQKPDVAAAVSNLEIAVKLEPENALFHYELGRAYVAAGRHEEGKRENDTFNRLKKTPQ
jgi:tetratricopeptide (TPR) repeat protein